MIPKRQTEVKKFQRVLKGQTPLRIMSHRRQVLADRNVQLVQVNIIKSLHTCKPREYLIVNISDSLARQALMAAQVLHLIPTEKARARNSLQTAAGLGMSMVGLSELNKLLPNREVKVITSSNDD